MFQQHQIIKLSVDLNPVLLKGMQGVILEVLDNNTFIIEFVRDDGSNYSYDDNFIFVVNTQQITAG